MRVNRITENIVLDRTKRLIITYGNINDEYCDDDLIIGNLDYMFWKYFKMNNFTRIIFFNPIKKIYFLDKESLDLCFSKNNVPISPGPLGKINLIEPLKIESNVENKKPKVVNSFFNNFQMLTSLIKEKIKTVIIFNNMEDITSQSVGKENFNYLNSHIKSWSKESNRSINKIVFNYNVKKYREIAKLCQENRITFFNNFFDLRARKNQKNILKINYPDNDEINNLIHHFRLVKNLKIDWELIDEIIPFIQKQKISLIKLDNLLEEIPNEKTLDLNTLHKWNENRIFVDNMAITINNIGKKIDYKELIDTSLIYDQEDSMKIIANGIYSYLYNEKSFSPIFFLLLGKTCTGKSYSVKVVSNSLKKIGYKLFSFNENNYFEKLNKNNFISVLELLVENLSFHNKRIIFFNKIELYKPEVIELINKLFNKEYLAKNNLNLDFSKTIVFFTSNYNSTDFLELKENDSLSNSINFQNKIVKNISDSKMSPIINLIDYFCVFNQLSKENIIKIIYSETNKISEQYNLKISNIEDELLEELAKSFMENIFGIENYQKFLLSKLNFGLANYNSQINQKNTIELYKSGSEILLK